MVTKRETEMMVIIALAVMILPWLRRQHSTTPVVLVPPPAPLASPAGPRPRRSLWSIVRQVVLQFSADRIMAEAAGVTFFALLALFPALAALVSLYGLVADPQAVSAQLTDLTGLIPAGGMDLLTEELKHLTSSGQGALSFGAVVGLLTSLWSANAGMKALFDALNAVYEQRETRSWVQLTARSLAFTLCSLAFMILATVAVVVLPAVLNFVGFGRITDLTLRLVRWPMLLAALTLFLAVLYRFGPAKTRSRWRWLSWGSVFSAVAWVIASAAFSWYVASFGSYNKTYGSLGAVIGFMTWIWISAMIVLTGAELNNEIENPTALPAPSTRPAVLQRADELLRA